MSREERWTLTALLSLMLVTAGWWALALWPSSAGESPWLARTQAVCFGVTESGLPTFTGWVGLTAPPLGMLLILLISANDSIHRLRFRLRSTRWFQVVAVTVLLLSIAGGATAALRISSVYASARNELITADAGAAVKSDRAAPSLSLTDQSGRVVSLDDFGTRVVIVTFAFAHCETVCPLLVRNALAAQTALARSADPVTLLIVTLDPRRDTPSRLPTIARAWDLGEDAHVLSGAPAVVEAALDGWAVARSYDDRTGDVIHPSVAYIVRSGRILYEMSAPSTRLLVELAGSL